jgi:hypothetical protein
MVPINGVQLSSHFAENVLYREYKLLSCVSITAQGLRRDKSHGFGRMG